MDAIERRDCTDKKGRANFDPALALCQLDIDYFLNFFLNPTSPTRPVPSKSKVEGSGMGASGTGIIALAALVIPRTSAITHKNTDNLFTVSPPFT